MKTLEERIAVMQHYVDGGKVKFNGAIWVRDNSVSNLNFNESNFPYEIYEEPKPIPWTWEDLMEHVDCWFFNKEAGKAFRIDCINADSRYVWTVLQDKYIPYTCFIEDYQLYDPKTGECKPLIKEV